MKRTSTNSAKDARIFKKTNGKIKTINIAPRNKRGGIRL